jgi:hypothetical protein
MQQLDSTLYIKYLAVVLRDGICSACKAVKNPENDPFGVDRESSLARHQCSLQLSVSRYFLSGTYRVRYSILCLDRSERDADSILLGRVLMRAIVRAKRYT